MKNNSFLAFLSVVLLFFIGLVFWLMVKLVIPVNPQYPYFPDKDDRIGGTHWNLGEFQPVYLYFFSNKENYFIKVAYRDEKQKIRLMNVLVGKSGEDSIPFVRVGKSEDGVADIGSIREYGKYFRIGSRVHVTYVRNVLKRPGDFFEIDEPNEENTKYICAVSKMTCFSVKLAFTKAVEFWNFPNTKDFPSDLLFPSIFLSKKLLN